MNVIKRFLMIFSKAFYELPYPLLFSDYFMKSYTQLENWDMFLEKWQIQTISEDKIEQLFKNKEEIKELTGFTTWLEMKQKAEEIYYEQYPFGIQPMH